MRNLCAGLLALVFLAGCNCSGGNPNVTPAHTDTGSSVASSSSTSGADASVPKIVDATYSIDNWNITLPSSWELQQESSVLGLWIHKANGTNLMLDKRKCGGGF